MPVSDAFVCLIIGLLLLQAAVRLPSALRGQRRERSLWGAFAAFAAAWWLRTDTGRAVVGPLGMNDLPTLLKHALAIVGICVLLTYVTDVYRDDDATARHIKITSVVHRTAARASLATVVCLIAVFFLALDRSKTAVNSPYFMGRHAGEPGLALYLGLFNFYTAAAAAVCAYQWGRAARLARRWSLRAGLTMMATGMALMVLYAVLRTAYLGVIALHPAAASAGTTQEHVTDTVLYAASLLWLLGSITPATHALATRVRALKALAGLHALWRDLVLAVDGVALHQPSGLLCGRRAAGVINLVRDIFSHDATPQIRLGRYVTEIRDVTHELRRRAPSDLLQRARRLAEAEGHVADDGAAVAEAYWLKAALAFADAPAGAPAAFYTAGDDFASEVPLLLRVSRAYRQASPHTRAILDALAPAHDPHTAK
ncbi:MULTISPECIES: MAB_1171c family putative transporter [unclassified Streptomyces]|uniref:MAB_1171c family putative transporter n=1 Tax=unclassified Streptomyces TaxID=2593676 RepID=UPI0033C83BE2